MNPYYDQLLSQYAPNLYKSQQQPEKTPEMLLNEMKQAKYSEFCNTPEGAKAVQDLQIVFDNWYNSRYNPASVNNSKEISELKEMVATLAQQIQTMNRNPSNVGNTNNHSNNHNK